MGKENWLELISEKQLSAKLQQTNQYTQEYGLVLTQQDTELLIAEKTDTLRAEQRVEFGESILPQIIFHFCDSMYISQENYVDSLVRLQQIFFLFKNEMQDEITDDELLVFMREQFDDVCFGDFDYLEGTVLEIFAEAIRAGYTDYVYSGGGGDFRKMDIVTRWDRDLFLAALENQF